MKTLFRAALLGSAVLALSAAAVPAQEAMAHPPAGHMMQHHAPTLSISATGEVKAEPDMATINFGVVTEAKTAAEAMRLNSEQMNRVMAAVRRQGVQDKDVQTSGLNLQALYTYRENMPPELRGYQASNSVTVAINDLKKTGATIDAVVSAGVNQINGVSFGLRDPKQAENAARVAAARELQARAQLYAGALGMRIKTLRSFNEGGGYVPPAPVMYRMEAAMAVPDAAPTPISPGQLTIRIDVSGVYELEK